MKNNTGKCKTAKGSAARRALSNVDLALAERGERIRKTWRRMVGES